MPDRVAAPSRSQGGNDRIVLVPLPRDQIGRCCQVQRLYPFFVSLTGGSEIEKVIRAILKPDERAGGPGGIRRSFNTAPFENGIAHVLFPCQEIVAPCKSHGGKCDESVSSLCVIRASISRIDHSVFAPTAVEPNYR